MKQSNFDFFVFDGQNVELRPAETVLNCLLQSNIEISHSCGGNGTCGTCRVFVVTGSESFEGRNEIESEMAADRKFAENERLACQIYPISRAHLKTVK